ncbi:MAG: electron transfer flavoprotein subunit beta/FixA family protein [Candidatus Omnitrophica bacterium]|nr:electron transfer flavoprotein subunit beta/FixA family protein [Candidatus Omnitrophota bacterium]MCB9782497.1 electron transfer flavoprotein subunit beta/FixA family protein [Candidatus Omnitrophota bacterium]
MKIVALVKQTFTTEAKIKLDESGKIADAGVKKVVNPYDEFGVEEAILLKEAGKADHITVVTLGPPTAQESSRQCLAMGADDAILIDNTGHDDLDDVAVAESIAAVLKGLEFDLLFAGFTSVDDNSAQVALRVAEILEIPHVNVVSKVEVGDGEVTAWREADGRTEVMSLPLPALVTADKSLNKPRYPKLPNIMKAKKKPLETKAIGDLGVDLGSPKTKAVKFELPPAKTGAKMLEGTPAEAAAALVQALRNEAKVV